MKINETNLKQLFDSSLKTKQDHEQKLKGDSFKEVFNKAISDNDNSVAKTQNANNHSTDGMEDFQPIQANALTVAEETISLMEHFSNNISGKNINRTVLNTLAETMENKVEDLKTLRDGLDFSDPLRENIDVIGSLTVVEAAKIRRGYYS